MKNNKETTTKFLDLLMYKVYTHGNIITEEEDEKIRRSFKLQIHWNKNRNDLPKRIKEML